MTDNLTTHLVDALRSLDAVISVVRQRTSTRYWKETHEALVLVRHDLAQAIACRVTELAEAQGRRFREVALDLLGELWYEGLAEEAP